MRGFLRDAVLVLWVAAWFYLVLTIFYVLFMGSVEGVPPPIHLITASPHTTLIPPVTTTPFR